MNLYETTVVVDSMLKSEDIQTLGDHIKNFISNNGGEVVNQEDWGKRRLAYEINKKQYGYYVHFRFSAPPAIIKLLENEYRLNESVLRYLTVKVDHRALKKEKAEGQSQLRPPEPQASSDTPSDSDTEDEANQ